MLRESSPYKVSTPLVEARTNGLDFREDCVSEGSVSMKTSLSKCLESGAAFWDSTCYRDERGKEQGRLSEGITTVRFK
jgi:hypothetical protein